MMALPMNSLYSLTWGDYGTSLVSAIQLLRCHGDLVDCTLAAGGRSFPAHKIVLCAASPFLLDLLKNTPCKHPVVMLAGVNANDLEALLEFVYRGEVSVDHAQLPSLLQAAQCLNIQGLAPQTVTKDDYTTHSIQLQHMIPQHHHEQEQLIATIATAPQQTVHAQVVDDIHQAGQILQTTTQTNQATGQQTIVTTDATKDVIQQYLPARKRKPRVKKMSPTAPKITKVDGMETIISTPTTSHPTTTVQTTQQHHQQQVQQQQQQQIENGNDNQMITSTPIIKSEGTKVETIVMDPNTSGEISISTPGKSSKRSKNLSGEKPRSRSQSEQPATCPICYAVIRQSRNLRRHLELRHFAKPGVKKDKKTPGKKTAMAVPPGSSNASGTSTVTTTSVSTVPQVQSVQSLHTLQTVQVKKDPDAQNQGQQTMTVTTTNTGQQQQQQQQQQQTQQQQVQQVQVQQTQQIQQHHIIDQSGNISTTTTTTNTPQQQQQQAAQQQQQQQQQQAAQQQQTQQGQQIVTQTENTDGTTSLSIAQVQTLQGHQILGNINQAVIIRNDDPTI
ncbi:transcription factor GAGA isoform X2 [Stomoxys calcitrans]|uniref:transcription factor GAGA isoform X2 n=1 Tax=Stomoxys calcitrans TaxID=35570 RepID=UPI0027E313A4|nr:transcription factor GAGA isoform X2 [Stomoxys calcitrans]